MSRSGRVGRILRGALFENFWLKLIALVFSLGLYAFMHSGQNAARTISVAIIAQRPPIGSKRVLVSQVPEVVKVRVVGPSTQLDTIRPEDIDPIELNLTAGQTVPALELTPSMVADLPPGVRVERINPPTLEIHFEDVTARPIQVQVPRTGSPAEGMEVISVTRVDPQIVNATGIESAVTVLQFARAEPFDVSGLSEGKHTRRLKLDNPPISVQFEPNTIEATVEIGRKLATVNFERLPIEVVGLPRATVKPDTVDIIVTGPPERVSALRREAIVPRVEPKVEDPSQPGSASLPVVVDIPQVTVEVSTPNVVVRW
jgi:YbbR domain-containing protein